MTDNNNESFFIKEYFDLRNEMTAWFQRLTLTLTYNFCLLALVAMLGSELILFNNQKVNLPSLFLVTIMVLIVSSGGARMMGRLYTAIFRQGSYLRIYYKDKAKWIENNRNFWDLHDKEPVSPHLRWVKGGTEVHIMGGMLGGFGVTSIIMLCIGGSSITCETFCSAFLAYISGIIILLSVIVFWVLSLYRLWGTKEHKKLWEEGWQKLLDRQTKGT